MNRVWLSFLFIFLCSYSNCYAKEQRDTLWTQDNDCIILSYDIKYNSGEIDIKFLKARKKLGQLHSRKYKKLEEVDVVFFDRTGVYEDVSFTNMIPEAFMIPSNLHYRRSTMGYFSLQESPSLSFKLVDSNSAILSIPLYLAHYEGKGKRKLFSVCNDFQIKLSLPAEVKKISSGVKTRSEVITSTYEVESNNDEAIIVMSQVDNVRRHLEVQTKPEFSSELQYEINYLRDLKKTVKDKNLVPIINETLTACELKREELEAQSIADIQRAKEEAAQFARLQEEKERIRQDSLQMVMQEQAKAEKERNVWMIIGGVILSVLCFVGSQVFQHFRNIKNQKSMMEMQESIVHRAEYEAKRQAQNYARRKTNEAVNSVRKGARDIMHNQVKPSMGKNKKNISI